MVSPPQDRPTAASVVVTLLIFTAAAGTIALFAVPTSSRWFWPTAGVLGLSIAAGLLIPLKRRP